MTHEELEASVPLYAAGALDRTERQALEAHLLSGCSACHAALKDYQSIAALLPLSLSPIKPPQALKSKIMAERGPAPVPVELPPKVEPVRESLEPGEWMDHLFPAVAPAKSSSLPWALGIAAALVVVVVGLLAWYVSTQRSLNTSNMNQLEASLKDKSAALTAAQGETKEQAKTLDELRNELQRKTHDLAVAKEQLALRETELEEARTQLTQHNGSRTIATPQDELATLLRIPNIKAVSLAGSDVAKQAIGILLYDSRTQNVWLYSVNLPECPAGTTYQLWAVHDKPVGIGTFRMNAGETARLLVKKLPTFNEAKNFAVSLEPSGGSPQPTGQIYLLSRS